MRSATPSPRSAAADPDARLNILAANGSRLLATTWGDTLFVLRRRRRRGAGQRTVRRRPTSGRRSPTATSSTSPDRTSTLTALERIGMTLSLSNHLAADSATRALRRDVYDGLTQTPKSLPPKWFYDSVGSDLFDQITRLPEYYPTRAEAEILRGRVGGDRRRVRRRHPGRAGQRHLGEDPAAAGRAARRRLAAPVRPVRRRRRACCRRPARRSSASTRASRSTPSAATSRSTSTRFPAVGRRLVVFLGSTIGNLTPGPRAEFLSTLSDDAATGRHPAAGHRPGQGHRPAGARLRRQRGCDGAVQPQRARGGEPRTRRRLRPRRVRACRPLEHRRGAHRDVAAGEHGATRDGRRAGSDRRLRRGRGDAHRGVVQVPARRRCSAELADAGLRRTHWWTDKAGDFGLSLSTK